jgi:alpha-tubulin suppressor-like RCC1 family protein
VFGKGDAGQLAHDEEFRATPTRVEQLAGKRFVGGSANWLYTLLVTDEGRVWTWGDNRYGQLGLIYRRNNVLYDPEMIQPLKPLTVLEAAAGRAHTLVRTKEGLVFSFGNTEFGQLGHGTAADQASELPRPIEALKGKHIVTIGSGFDHCVALRDDGRVYVWGYNGDYQLALGDESDRAVPVLHPDVRDVVQLSVGADFALGLTNNGDVWGWGNNDIGQLGNGTTSTVPKVSKVSTNGLHFKHVIGGGFSALGVTRDNHVYRWGRFATEQGETGPQPVLKPELLPFFDTLQQPIKALAAGGHHFLALTEDGALYSWGLNEFGQLGTGDTTARDQPTPLNFFADKRVKHVIAGMEHTVVITEDE